MLFVIEEHSAELSGVRKKYYIVAYDNQP
jgi:hypothetical protein